MLRREDSNKILKRVKVVLFATSLSLLNPINVDAKEIVPQQTHEENNELDVTAKVQLGIAGGLAIGSIIAAIISHRELKNAPSIDLVQGKLSDEESVDDIGEAVKCLKITNSRKEVK